MLYPISQIGAVATTEPRSGALLKMEWPDKKVGYADIFPWPEFGDADIDTQLLALARGRISFLVEQAIWLGRKDAIMRSMGVNGLHGGTKIKNHFLITDFTTIADRHIADIKNAGFTTVKIKCGRNIHLEALFIQKLINQFALMVRVDFNSRLDFSNFQRFMGFFSQRDISKIEYIEDPFPYDTANWTEASKLVPLAVDFEYENVDWSHIKSPPFKVIIIKPSRMDVDRAIGRCTTFNLKYSVTSSLDHPVGIVHAAIVAGELRKNYGTYFLDSGCLSLRAYKSTEFNNKILVQGPYITQVTGLGIGFDDVLEGQDWQLLTR